MSRILKDGLQGESGVEITSNSAKMYGNSENLFYVDHTGAYIVGKVSIHAQPEQVKIGGMFNFPRAYEMMIPSTAVSPRPMLIPSPGIDGFLEIASVVTDLLSSLPGL